MVNAAMTTTLVLAHFAPDIVLLSAIAGGLHPGLNLGDVVISERTIQYECGQVLAERFRAWGTWDPFTNSENPLYSPGDSCILEAVGDIGDEVDLRDAVSKTGPVRAKVVKGTVASADKVVQDTATKESLHRTYSADVVHTECGAIAQICFQKHVPMVGVLGISDLADEHFESDGEIGYEIATCNADRTTLGILDWLDPRILQRMTEDPE